MGQNRPYSRPIAVCVAAVLLLGGCAAPAPESSENEPEAASTRSASIPAEQPTPTPTPTVAAPTLMTFSTQDGMFQFQYPAEWTVAAEPAAPGTQGESVTVEDAEGRKIATFSTGHPGAYDGVVVGPTKPVALEYHKLPSTQIAPLNEGTTIAFHYETQFNPVRGENGASMSVDTFRTDFPISSSIPGFNIDTTTGASFGGWISETDLASVDPSLKGTTGIQMFEAYQKTSEYQAVKAMMISLRRL